MKHLSEFDAADLAALAAQDVARALAEDVATGDLTAALVDPQRPARARILARESAVVCGQPWVEAAVRALDPQARLNWHVAEGARCQADQTVLTIEGRAQPLLTAERTALNFLQRLSGIATLTARYVQAVEGTRARILDTRKTTPTLRPLEKAAVVAGGGTSHRFGLFDMVLIKENHIAAAGGITPAIASARERYPDLPLEVECQTADEVAEALAANAPRILLDNMTPDQMRAIVADVGDRAELEASGGIDLDTVRAVAETGVHCISVGALTHSAPALDLSLILERLP